MRLALKGNAASPMKTCGKVGTVVPGRGWGAGRSSFPASRPEPKMLSANTPPSDSLPNAPTSTMVNRCLASHTASKHYGVASFIVVE